MIPNGFTIVNLFFHSAILHAHIDRHMGAKNANIKNNRHYNEVNRGSNKKRKPTLKPFDLIRYARKVINI